MLWLGNFKTSGCLVGKPTCAPTTTRLTPQVVGTSTITYNPSPYIGSQTGLWLKFQASSPVFRTLYPQSAHFSDYFVSLFDVSTGHQRCFYSKVQLFGITSYVRSGKSLTFDFYASDMDSLWIGWIVADTVRLFCFCYQSARFFAT